MDRAGICAAAVATTCGAAVLCSAVLCATAAVEARCPPPELPRELVEAYLVRLGVARPAAPTVGALVELTRAHVDRIAYEDLDIHLGRLPSSLEPRETAARVALEGRGGYCFQLGGAFASLLASLGFDVFVHRATVRNSIEDEGAGPPLLSNPAGVLELNHLAVIVRFKQANGSDLLYLADVGLGDGPSSPVPLIEGPYDESPFSYAVEKKPWGWRFIHDKQHGSFSHFDLAMDAEATADEFIAAHEKLSTDPESSFVKVATAQRRSESAVHVLKRCTLTTIGGVSDESGGPAVVVLEDEAAWFGALRDTFGLGFATVSAEEKAKLWEKVLADHAAELETREARGDEQAAVQAAGPGVAGAQGFAARRRQ